MKIILIITLLYILAMIIAIVLVLNGKLVAGLITIAAASIIPALYYIINLLVEIID